MIAFPLEKVKFSGIFDVIYRDEVGVTYLLKVIHKSDLENRIH